MTKLWRKFQDSRGMMTFHRFWERVWNSLNRSVTHKKAAELTQDVAMQVPQSLYVSTVMLDNAVLSRGQRSSQSFSTYSKQNIWEKVNDTQNIFLQLSFPEIHTWPDTYLNYFLEHPNNPGK